MKSIVIIGGGAAGYFAAIAAAEANPQARVSILERSANVLSKVRISGGGRCNVTHACFDPATLVGYYPRGSRELRGPFTRFQPRNTMQWFESRGISLKIEPDGRVFPTSDNSATIVNGLIDAAQQAGVQVWGNINVRAITKTDDGRFSIHIDSAPHLEVDADCVLLATGGSAQGHAWAKALGHTIVPPVPSLFTFNVQDARLHDLAGVSVERCAIQLQDPTSETHSGPVLVTHWGMSGPAVLRLSAWEARRLHNAQYRATLHINWLADWRSDAVVDRLNACKREIGARRVATHAPFSEIPLRLWQRLVIGAEIFEEQQWAKLPKSSLLKLADQLCCGEYAITGKGVFKDEFVTCGGVALNEVNFKTMESRVQSGLYFAGEILDIDGVTGGFNFQNAWTTGWIAGHAMATT